MKKELPIRKSIRMKSFDYKTAGAYFVTVCTHDRKQILSEILKPSCISVSLSENNDTVGEGLDPPAYEQTVSDKINTAGAASYSPTSFHKFSLSLRYPEMKLTEIGNAAAEQLFALENRFSGVEIDEYVFMPDHIHAIIILHKDPSESESSVSLFDVMRVYKSLTSRYCKQQYGTEKLFQRSYIEHVIRDKEDYMTKRKYIFENPIRWYYEKYHK